MMYQYVQLMEAKRGGHPNYRAAISTLPPPGWTAIVVGGGNTSLFFFSVGSVGRPVQYRRSPGGLYTINITLHATKSK
jgi:hypothetical protein